MERGLRLCGSSKYLIRPAHQNVLYRPLFSLFSQKPNIMQCEPEIDKTSCMCMFNNPLRGYHHLRKGRWRWKGKKENDVSCFNCNSTHLFFYRKISFNIFSANILGICTWLATSLLYIYRMRHLKQKQMLKHPRTCP